MKENYIKQVKRNLMISRMQKNEVVRDLKEVFASALEHGETEQQVIDRLGEPANFADSIHEQLGINRMEKQKRKKKCQIGITLIIAAIVFAIGSLIDMSRIPGNVIGQVNAMTNIRVYGTAFDPFVLCMVIGVMILIVAVVLMIRYSDKKQGRSDK